MAKTDRSSFFSSLLSPLSAVPFRYKVFMLLTALSILVSIAAFGLSSTPGYESHFANIALFAFTIAFMLCTAGLTYLACFWHISMDWMPYPALRPVADLIWALITYAAGTVLIGSFLYVSLTALSSAVSDPSRFVFVSLMLGLIMLFLARLFSILSWRRAQDLVFSIVVYNVVIGTLFWEVTSVDLVSHLVVFGAYFQTLRWAYLHAILMALLFEWLARWMQKKWGEKTAPGA